MTRLKVAQAVTISERTGLGSGAQVACVRPANTDYAIRKAITEVVESLDRVPRRLSRHKAFRSIRIYVPTLPVHADEIMHAIPRTKALQFCESGSVSPTRTSKLNSAKR